MEYMPKKPTIATRRVALIIVDGYDLVAYNGVKAALSATGALPFTIGPRKNSIFATGKDKGSGKGVIPFAGGANSFQMTESFTDPVESTAVLVERLDWPGTT